MQTRRRFGLLICAGLLTAALSGCGGSSTSESIPSTPSIFYEHSVILKDGKVYTMGYNGFGQLGDGTLTKREIAVAVPGMENMILDGTKAVAGAEHTMVFGNISSLISTWGYNLYGQLGTTKVSNSYPNAYSSKPVEVWMHAKVEDLAAGGYHSLAVARGKLYAWGFNLYRQIGNNSSANATTPVNIVTARDPQGLDEDISAKIATNVAAGGLHSLALFNTGEVYAWGGNAHGQVGFGHDVKFDTYSAYSARPKKVAIPVTGTGTIEKIAALGSASLALEVQRTGGQITSEVLWGWGYNDAGELGPELGLLKNSSVPVKVLTLDVNSDQDLVIEKIATGTNHIVLLMRPRGIAVSDGSWKVQTIGNNYYGQLGNDTFTNSSSLVDLLWLSGLAQPSPITDIAAFGTSSFALVNGVWYAWGNNSMGQLGNTVETKAGVPYFKTPVTVKF